MKKIIALLVLIVITITACQRTPDDETVKRRDYEKLLEKNKRYGKMECPAEFSDEFMSKDKKVKITFDAKVIAPDADKYPVIKITPQPITEDIMQLVVDEFMGGETGYYPENYMTKSEIEERLLSYYARLENDELLKEGYEKNMPGVDIDYDAVQEAIKRNIAKFTEMLENAPEEKENVPTYYNLRPDMFYRTYDHNYRESELAMTQESLDRRAANPEENLYLVSDRQVGDEYLRLIVYNELPTMPGQPHNFGLFSREHYEIQFVRARNDYLQTFSSALSSANPTNGTTEGVENFDVPYPKLTISLEEATNLAQEKLGEFGLNDFYLANSRVIKATFSFEESQQMWANIENQNFSMKEYREKMDDKFYLLTFKPIYYDIPLIHASNRYSQEVIYSLPFSFEEIKVKVTNDEIVEFKWSNPTDTTHVLNENAKLMPFDEIAKIAVNHMKLKYNMITIASLPEDFPSYEEELAKFLSAEIKITEIKLGLGGVPAYNSPGEYMLIPVWSFYGSYSVEREGGEGEDKRLPDEDLYMPLLSINAVDGSIIEQFARVNYD